ncbi:MAG TPA: geranylgeranylglyceryl/heptaprenylglyceryl phosphate synthase [Thermoproteota archaeon]|nr:geranylgeranylglyceryl/heptaprenylglyceryl phosphate synthase [Thermoproteota archaeon]
MISSDEVVKIGRTERLIYDRLRRDRYLYFVLVDPEKPGDLKTLAHVAEEEGVSGFLVGGSTAQITSDYEATISELKRNGTLPVLIFPSGASSVAKGSDAIWFMSLLNSDDPHYIIGAQMLGIGGVRRLGLEAIPMGYVVVGYGGTAGLVGRARVIPYERPEVACGYAAAAEALGIRFIYLEGGSGAPKHVPPEFVAAVRRAIHIPLLVGGGITNGDAAAELVQAGADGIVTGTVLEGEPQIREKVREIAGGCKRAARSRQPKV